MRNTRLLLKRIIVAIYERILPTQMEQPLKDHTELTYSQKRLNSKSENNDFRPYKRDSSEMSRLMYALRDSLITSRYLRFRLDIHKSRKKVASDFKRLNIDKERTVQTFIHQALNSADKDKKDEAVHVLGLIGDTNAIEPLLRLLKEENNPNVLKSIATTLDNLDWTPKNDIEKACYMVAMENWDEVVMSGEAAVEPLIRILDFDFIGGGLNDARMAEAGKALLQIGKPAIEQLSLILNVHKDSVLKHNVQYVLKKIGERDNGITVSP